MSDSDGNRAVTAKDYESLAKDAADCQVKIARALGPRLHDSANQPAWRVGDPWTFGGINRARGNVTVIVVPDGDAANPTPQPSQELLQKVTAVLDARRTLASKLAVTGPRYLPITVVVDVQTRRRAIDEKVIKSGQLATQVLEAIRKFFHPTDGHDNCRGWSIGESVKAEDVLRAITPPDRLGVLSNLSILPAVPLYHAPPLGPGGLFDEYTERGFTNVAGPVVRVAEHELVCWDSVGTKVNDKGIL